MSALRVRAENICSYDFKDGRRANEANDRCDVKHENERQVAVKRSVDDIGWGAYEDRVAVRGGAHDGFSRDVGAGAWSVLDDEACAEPF